MKARALPLLLSLGLAIGAFIVFIPVAQFDFVNFDDPDYVTSNLHVQQGLKWDNVVWAFGSGYASNWHPLTWLSHMADCQMFGAKAGAHHLVSLVFHVLNTVFLFLVLRQFTGALWRSAVVAALFALHPMHVESVAWISERKDVLSTFFFMLTLWAYAAYAQRRKEQKKVTGEAKSNPSNSHLPTPIFYTLSLVAFALGLMAKQMLVTVPFLLLLLDYWPLKRGLDPKSNAIQLKEWNALAIEKVPFFLLAGLASVVTFLIQSRSGAVWSVADVSLVQRLENAVVAYCRYLGKLVWPVNLSIFYPHPGYWPIVSVVLACAFLLLVSALVWVFRRRPYLPVGWFWFVGTLVPVIGIVQVGWQSMADRYTYIPYIGLFILLVWLIEEQTRGWRARETVLAVSSSVILIVLAALTQSQLAYWKNSETLFTHSLAVTTNNFVAHHNLGQTLVYQGRTDEAITNFAAAVKLRPKYADSYNGLGEALLRQGRVEEAKQMFDKAVSLRPNLVVARNNLGIALTREGFIDQAITEFEAALKTRPDYAKACNNLGMAYQSKGRLDEAIVQLQQAVRLAPNDAEAHNNLGMALGRKGQLDQAIAQLQEAIRLNPRDPQARHNLGFALSRQGRFDEAIPSFVEALKLKPESPDTHAMLGAALAKKGRRDEAIAEFRTALKLRPGWAEVEKQLENLAQ